MARDEINRQSAGHWPSLDLVGSNGFYSTGGRLGAGDINASAVGLSLNLPLHEGGQVIPKPVRRPAGTRKASPPSRRASKRAAGLVWTGRSPGGNCSGPNAA